MKDNHFLWMIRDTEGLNTYEKMALLIVHSRGEYRASLERLATDMGCSKATAYRTVRALRERGLLTEEGVCGSGIKSYIIDLEVLEDLWRPWSEGLRNVVPLTTGDSHTDYAASSV